jgi:hypothetical protein
VDISTAGELAGLEKPLGTFYERINLGVFGTVGEFAAS